MKWFKKKPSGAPVSPEGGRCFRQKVEDFWVWWARESDRIYASVDSEGGRSIQPELSAQVNALCPKLGWVFSAGPDGVGHAFTLSPEADAHKRFLIRYWFSKAPTIEGWTFYPARQPSYDFGKTKIRLGESGAEVGAESLWITPAVDVENEEIDIAVWSPAFESMEEKHAMQILFLYLDEALGEEGTERCIGAIDVGDDKLDRSFPLTELPEYVDSVFGEHGWSQDVIGWCTFSAKEAEEDFPRADIFVGSTQHFALSQAYGREGAPIENPIPGSGAELIFLQLPAAIFPEGEEVDFRAEISDAIEAKFEEGDSGVVLGGATGRNASYIDLLLLDPDRAHRAIDEVLTPRDLKDQVQIFPFTR
jgi:hypothetical protein